MKKNLCIIPVWNERTHLLKLLKNIQKFKSKYKIDFLFINNGSTDSSDKMIKSFNCKIHSFKKNNGVGYALLWGLKYANKKKYNVIINLAGNNKMKPNEIDRFLDKIYLNNFDYVNGSRYKAGAVNKNLPFMRNFSIYYYSLIINFLYQSNITDSTCGFRAYKVKKFKKIINILSFKNYFTYGYEYAFYGFVLKYKNIIKSIEVPVSMIYNKNTKHSKIKIKDWFTILFYWLLPYFKNEKIF